MRTKIQQILENWPAGAVRTVSALKKLGYSQNLLNRYRYSGWLELLEDGALFRTGDTPTLVGAVQALQKDLQLKVHIGARSSLELKGRAHYFRSGKETLWIFGSEKRLPRWFTKHDWKSNIRYSSAKLFASYSNDGMELFKEGKLEILISDEVRAMLELLSLVPKEQSIEEAKELMLGLSNVHPAHVQKLLILCTSIKVKRLFLLLAEECGHAWVNKVDQKQIDLGSGARNLFPGGKLSQKYQITVPSSLFSDEGR